MNATFGWPTLMSSDLPSGGPAYPEATPGVRVTFAPSRAPRLRAAVFDGDPTGAGPGDPNRHGLALRVRDPPFVMVEAVFSRGGPGGGSSSTEAGGAIAAVNAADSLPGSISLGAWRWGPRRDARPFCHRCIRIS